MVLGTQSDEPMEKSISRGQLIHASTGMQKERDLALDSRLEYWTATAWCLGAKKRVLEKVLEWDLVIRLEVTMVSVC